MRNLCYSFEEIEQVETDVENLHKIYDRLVESSLNCKPELLPYYANAVSKLFSILYFE